MTYIAQRTALKRNIFNVLKSALIAIILSLISVELLTSCRDRKMPVSPSSTQDRMSLHLLTHTGVKKITGTFPGGPEVKNLPATAGDTGSTPGLGRSHVPWSNGACVPQLLILCSRVPALQQDKSLCNKPAHNREQPLHAATRGTLCAATKTQCSHKEIK